jgi:serine/threonine protein kinase
MIKNEVTAMQALDHKHLVKLVDFDLEGKYSSEGKEKKRTFMVLELALGGELFDFICDGQRLDEKTCRYFYKQIIEAIEKIHQSGFAHRDLKCENILLDKDFNIKVADFGFVAETKKKSDNGFL